jgi:hypothetical protein
MGPSVGEDMQASNLAVFRQRLRAVCVPSSDHAFANEVHRLLASHRIHTTVQLEVALRPIYPDVSVRRREISAEPDLTWYVYRDRDFTRS